MASEGVQIIYSPNAIPVTPATLNYPTQYTDAQGNAARLPNCSIPIKYGYAANNLKVEFETGHEQRRQKGMIRKTFDIEYKALDRWKVKALEDFFLECRGSVRAFNWTDPADGTSYIVRFENDNWAKEYFTHTSKSPLFRVAFKLIQVV